MLLTVPCELERPPCDFSSPFTCLPRAYRRVTVTSPISGLTVTCSPLWISWVAEEPHRSKVRFQVRVAKSKADLKNAPWLGASGEDSYFTERRSPLKTLPKGSWIQYRAVLDTYNGVNSPVLDAVEIAFE